MPVESMPSPAIASTPKENPRMSNAYPYPNIPRQDILRMVPADGQVIGSVGCGYAATEAELVRAGRTVYGVDVAPEVTQVATANLSKFDLIRPGDDLPWAPESLDGLILADVIEHLPFAWESLAKWSRFVRPGGWVIVSVPNMRSFVILGGFILKGDWPEVESGVYDKTHLQVMSTRRLLRWARNAGLELERIFDNYGPPGGRRSLLRTFDLCTLRLFRSWTMFQVQCLFRKPKSAAPATSLKG